MTISVKEQKEAFVTGHDGTTPWEVLGVCLSAPVSLACYQSFEKHFGPVNKATGILLEALLVWFPMVLCQTNYLYPYGVIVMILQVAVVVGAHVDKEKRKKDGNDISVSSTPLIMSKQSSRLEFLTAYRSSILYLTFIAILAVDFPVFPRRFCKTEVTGFGLMDVGAASFCISAGFVSPKARGKTTSWRKAVHTLPLVALGLIRILTNRELEYQEHVSEYGLHWNFFFTMGILALVPPLIPWAPTWILPVIVMCVYQVALSLGGLQDYIVSAPRYCNSIHDKEQMSILCHLFAANREGILGCLGYLSLFFWGEWIGHEYLWKQTDGLLQISILLWIVLGIFHTFLNIPISRRSTNATFCIWAAAHNMILLTFLKWTTSSRVPWVWETVNRYGLWMFLIANLLTGLVNLTVPTLEMNDPAALVIVFGYICCVGMAALLVDAAWSRVTASNRDVSDSKKKG